MGEMSLKVSLRPPNLNQSNESRWSAIRLGTSITSGILAKLRRSRLVVLTFEGLCRRVKRDSSFIENFYTARHDKLGDNNRKVVCYENSEVKSTEKLQIPEERCAYLHDKNSLSDTGFLLSAQSLEKKRRHGSC
jgi:NADH:ubiquinone oxidoreductase subunit